MIQIVLSIVGAIISIAFVWKTWVLISLGIQWLRIHMGC